MMSISVEPFSVVVASCLSSDSGTTCACASVLVEFSVVDSGSTVSHNISTT